MSIYFWIGLVVIALLIKNGGVRLPNVLKSTSGTSGFKQYFKMMPKINRNIIVVITVIGLGYAVFGTDLVAVLLSPDWWHTLRPIKAWEAQHGALSGKQLLVTVIVCIALLGPLVAHIMERSTKAPANRTGLASKFLFSILAACIILLILPPTAKYVGEWLGVEMTSTAVSSSSTTTAKTVSWCRQLAAVLKPGASVTPGTVCREAGHQLEFRLKPGSELDMAFTTVTTVTKTVGGKKVEVTPWDILTVLRRGEESGWVVYVVSLNGKGYNKLFGSSPAPEVTFTASAVK